MHESVAVFGGGCFWCTEALFKELRGVLSVMPGYAGGTTEKPSYEEVSSGRTGHAEAIKIEFDPAQVSYRDLLEVFFSTHDPTTLNRQGGDVGTQYRSIVLYADEAQKRAAEAVMAELKKLVGAPGSGSGAGFGGREIVTELKPLGAFYEAEAYHRDYYEKNRGTNPYCQVVIDPKLAKFRAKFKALLK